MKVLKEAKWPLIWLFQNGPAPCQGEILLDKVASRYTRNFLRVL
jgi:hypothetical protein